MNDTFSADFSRSRSPSRSASGTISLPRRHLQTLGRVAEGIGRVAQQADFEIRRLSEECRFLKQQLEATLAALAQAQSELAALRAVKGQGKGQARLARGSVGLENRIAFVQTFDPTP